MRLYKNIPNIQCNPFSEAILSISKPLWRDHFSIVKKTRKVLNFITYLLKGYIHSEKGVALQKGCHCISIGYK